MKELSYEEQEILNELQSEDTPHVEQYHEDDTIQRNIIGALLTDRYFLLHSLGLVKPLYFVNEAHQLFCKILFKYHDIYKKPPPKQIVYQEMEDEIVNKKPDIKQYFRSEFHTVYDYYIPGIDSRDYLLDRITHFAKTQALKTAFKQSLDELYKKRGPDTWTKIYDILKSALTIDRTFSFGLDYFQSFEERYARMIEQQEQGDLFTSSFQAIDDAIVGGGMSRGEVGVWMGLPGTGKSLALVAASIANVNRGKKVLYLSLEMDQDKVAERFDAQYATTSFKNKGKVTVNNLIENKNLVFEALQEIVDELEDQQMLIVKQFPAGGMDIPQLRAYLTQCKLRGFSPDVLVLDYVGEMKDYPGMPTWESRNKIVRDLRGLAVEEDICIFTAMQPDRKAREQSNDQKELGFIDDSNLADAFGQSRPVDAMWSINQFQEEKDCGLARIFVVKHRHGKSRFTFHVEFDYNTLRMTQITQNSYDKRIKEYRNSKEVVAKKQSEKQLQLDRIIGGSNSHLKKIGSDE